MQGMALGSALPPAHAQERLEFSPEALIQPAVDEGIVAGAAHCKPVKGKVERVVAADDLAGHEHQVAVQGEPTDGKDDHHQHEHLEGHLLLTAVRVVLFQGDVPYGITQPQLLGHCCVCDGNDQQG